MRGWLLVCAALALAACRAAAHAHHDTAHTAHSAHSAHSAHNAHTTHNAHTAHAAGTQRLERIKAQILAKLGLTSRPRPQDAPPHDVAWQILARAADPQPERPHEDTEHAMREIIAIAHRGFTCTFTETRKTEECTST